VKHTMLRPISFEFWSCTGVMWNETKRPLKQRFREHTNLDKGDHCRATGYSVHL